MQRHEVMVGDSDPFSFGEEIEFPEKFYWSRNMVKSYLESQPDIENELFDAFQWLTKIPLYRQNDPDFEHDRQYDSEFEHDDDNVPKKYRYVKQGDWKFETLCRSKPGVSFSFETAYPYYIKQSDCMEISNVELDDSASFKIESGKELEQKCGENITQQNVDTE